MYLVRYKDTEALCDATHHRVLAVQIGQDLYADNGKLIRKGSTLLTFARHLSRQNVLPFDKARILHRRKIDFVLGTVNTTENKGKRERVFEYEDFAEALVFQVLATAYDIVVGRNKLYFTLEKSNGVRAKICFTHESGFEIASLPQGADNQSWAIREKNHLVTEYIRMKQQAYAGIPPRLSG